MENLRGIILMSSAMALFALEDVFIKIAAANVPMWQILILMGAVGALVFGGWSRARGETLWPDALTHRAVILRNIGELFGTLCFVSALIRLPLATTTSIFMATPLVVTMGAALFLGSSVGWRRWSAMGVGFLGVVIVIRPGLDAFQPAALWALGATLLLALRDLATRSSPPSMSSPQLAFWGFVMAGGAGLILLPFGPAPVLPAAADAARLAGALCFGLAAYYALTAATRVGDLAVTTPFRYSRLLFAIALGMALLGERPDGLTLLGAALILASGLYTLSRERRLARQTLSTAAQPG